MIIFLLGPQGSGKGTQGEMLGHELGYFYLSTGQMFRELAKTNPDIEKTIDKGELIADDAVLDYLKDYLVAHKIKDNLILDGTPRSVHQYQKLKKWFEEQGSTSFVSIYLSISEEETTKRLSARRMDKTTGKIYNLLTNPPGSEVNPENLVQRDDDVPDAIKVRLEKFHQETEPLISLMKKDGILVEIDGERPIETIFADIVKTIKEKQ